MVDHRLDHRRRTLHRRRRKRDHRRDRGGRGLAGEERFREVGEEPRQAEGADQAAEGGKPDDEDGPVASSFLGPPIHQLSPGSVGSGCRLGSAVGLAVGLAACFGGSYTSITLCTG